MKPRNAQSILNGIPDSANRKKQQYVTEFANHEPQGQVHHGVSGSSKRLTETAGRLIRISLAHDSPTQSDNIVGAVAEAGFLNNGEAIPKDSTDPSLTVTAVVDGGYGSQTAVWFTDENPCI